MERWRLSFPLSCDPRQIACLSLYLLGLGIVFDSMVKNVCIELDLNDSRTMILESKDFCLISIGEFIRKVNLELKHQQSGCYISIIFFT